MSEYITTQIGSATIVSLPPAPPEPAGIPPVSPRQIRQALTAVGLRSAVEAAVLAGDQDLQDWWQFSTAFERVHPAVVAMGAGLGQTPEQLDSLWLIAGSL